MDLYPVIAGFRKQDDATLVMTQILNEGVTEYQRLTFFKQILLDF